MRISSTGKKQSEETKEKLRLFNLGKSLTPESRAKMSAAQKDFVTALNIETGVAARIPVELYHSRRDIYFTNRSKVYQQWKSNQQ